MAILTFHDVVEKEQDLFTDAINFIIKKYMPRIDNNIYIEIRNKENLGVWGICDWIDTNNKPRMFIIELENSISIQVKLETLFHEMIHVKQFAKGELMSYLRYRSPDINSEDRPYMMKWKGKPFNCKGIMTKEFPWEIEANEKGESLSIQFIKESPKYKGILLE